MHAQLSLTLVHRLCACIEYAGTGAGEARVAHVTFSVGEAVWCLWYPSCDGPARLPSPLPKNTIVRDQYLSRAYLKVSDCVTHIWPIPMVCNDIPRDIPECHPPRTFVRIDPRFRASR